MKLIGLLAAFSLSICGCASPQNIAMRHRAVSMDGGDSVKALAEAKEALQILKDNSVFPRRNPADLEIGDYSLVLRGYDKVLGPTSSFAPAGASPMDGYVASWIAGNRETRHDQSTIWFKDIKEVQVFHQTLFNMEDAGASRAAAKLQREAFVCRLLMKDGHSVVFEGTMESSVKRLASAFALIAKAPVVTSLAYPPSGCLLDQFSGMIVALDENGPVAKAGIPLYSTIKKIDGKKVDGPMGTGKALNQLAPGKHGLTYEDFDSYFSNDAELVILQQ